MLRCCTRSVIESSGISGIAVPVTELQTSYSGARVFFQGDEPRNSVLLNDNIGIVDGDHPLDLDVLMTARDEKMRPVAANGLILAKRQQKPFEAAARRALTDELVRRRGPERAGEPNDVLVEGPKEHLILGKPLLAFFAHPVQRTARGGESKVGGRLQLGGSKVAESGIELPRWGRQARGNVSCLVRHRSQWSPDSRFTPPAWCLTGDAECREVDAVERFVALAGDPSSATLRGSRTAHRLDTRSFALSATSG